MRVVVEVWGAVPTWRVEEAIRVSLTLRVELKVEDAKT